MAPTCPVCGSENTSEETVNETVSVPYGPPVEYEVVTNTCADCDMCGDFEAKNDDPITEALARSNKAAVVLMLDTLANKGITNAYFERALRLPARTINRWKSGSISASSLALLRLIRTFPWLLHVADNNFTPDVVAHATLASAGLLVASTMTPDDLPPRFFFPSGSLTGGDATTSKNLPTCPECGTVMIVIEGVAAHCPECFHKQKYPWKVPEDS